MATSVTGKGGASASQAPAPEPREPAPERKAEPVTERRAEPLEPRAPRSRQSAVLSAVKAEDQEVEAPVPDGHLILIAEDDPVSRRLLEQAVHSWGYSTICVTDGAIALAKLSAQNGPRLAILDWEMPGLSGPQVCRILRARTASPWPS